MAKKPVIRTEEEYQAIWQKQYDAVRAADHGDGMARWSADLTVRDQRRKDLGTTPVGTGDTDIDALIAGDASISRVPPDFDF